MNSFKIMLAIIKNNMASSLNDILIIDADIAKTSMNNMLVIKFNITKYEKLPGYTWSVDVIKCDAFGVPLKGESIRNHCTQPHERDRIIIK